MIQRLKKYENFFLFFLCFVLLLSILASITNSLEKEGEWLHGGERYLPGEEKDFSIKRQTLAGGKLRVGAFGGFQEVYYNKKINAKEAEISGNVLIADESFFFVFIKDARNYRFGIRLGLSAINPSRFLVVSPSGEFISSQKINLKIPLGNFPFSMRLKESQLSININGVKEFFNLSHIVNKPFRLGVKGGVRNDSLLFSQGVDIDNISILVDGVTIFHDSFSGNWSGENIAISLALAFSLLVISYLTKGVLLPLFRILIICLFCFYCMEYFLLSYRQFNLSFFDADPWKDDILANANIKMSNYQKSLENRSKRLILLIGGSKTAGAGALSKKETWPVYFEKSLKKNKKNVSIVNMGICAASTRHMRKYYEKALKAIKPDMTIFLIGINDRQHSDMAVNFLELVRLNKNYDIKTVLSPEIFFTDTLSGDDYQNYQILKKIAKENEDIEWIDTYSKMQDVLRSDQGIYWDDCIHFSTYGQLRFAQELEKLLKKSRLWKEL